MDYNKIQEWKTENKPIANPLDSPIYLLLLFVDFVNEVGRIYSNSVEFRARKRAVLFIGPSN